jgi:hypothetical protein
MLSWARFALPRLEILTEQRSTPPPLLRQAIAESYGFNSLELARILRIVAERRTLILKAWDDHFGNCGSF